MLGIKGLEIIPEHCRETVHDYIVKGTPVGEFLTYVFSNDMVGAFAKADDINRAHLFDYAMFLYNHAPVDCWGSEEKVKKWIARKVCVQKTFDQKCYDLAMYFLGDDPLWSLIPGRKERLAEELAKEIQETIEEWLIRHADANP